MTIQRAMALAAATILFAPRLGAQANPSAEAVSLGSAFTAAARGADAIAWNPAGLALPGTGAFSFNILPLNGQGGTGPITGKDLKPYSGINVPAGIRQQWLARITAAGGQALSGGVDASLLAINIRNIGISLSSSARLSGNIPPDAAQLILFGNTGLTGVPQSFNLTGARAEGSVISTAALSFGKELNVRIGAASEQHFAFGITAKYVFGNVLGIARDAGSSLSGAPIVVGLNALLVASDSTTDNYQPFRSRGNGFGADIGLAWQGGPFKLGVAVHDVVNTFKWNTSTFVARTTQVTFNGTTRVQNTGPFVPFASLPDSIRIPAENDINGLTIKPTVAVGASYDLFSRLTLSGEYAARLGDGLSLQPKSRVSAGVQLRLIPLIPLRAGFMQTPDATFITGGLGLHFGAVFGIDLAGGVNTKSSGDGLAAVTIRIGR